MHVPVRCATLRPIWDREEFRVVFLLYTYPYYLGVSLFLQILLKTMLSTNEPITPTIVYYFACCVFRSRPPGPYLLSSRTLIHGAPALTHSSGGARGRPPGEPPI